MFLLFSTTTTTTTINTTTTTTTTTDGILVLELYKSRWRGYTAMCILNNNMVLVTKNMILIDIY